MDRTIEAGATDAQLETLGELLLLEANYLQYSCDYQSQKRYFLQAAVFICRFPMFVFGQMRVSLYRRENAPGAAELLEDVVMIAFDCGEQFLACNFPIFCRCCFHPPRTPRCVDFLGEGFDFFLQSTFAERAGDSISPWSGSCGPSENRRISAEVLRSGRCSLYHPGNMPRITRLHL